jgi:arylsulfatase A-like enzyme
MSFGRRHSKAGSPGGLRNVLMHGCKFFACAFVFSTMSTLGFAKSPDARPNVLLIITDDEQNDFLGCTGGKVKTPNIDSIAAEGIRFANGIVPHSVCSPSRYAILTGRYYDNNFGPERMAQYPRGTASCIDNDIYLEKDGMNLPSILQKNGYATGFVGKFHLTGHEYLQNNKTWEASGLQTYSENAKASDPEVSAKMKANHDFWRKKIAPFGFDYVNGVYAANLRELFLDEANAHNVEWTADAAIRFIDEQAKTDRPFFLYVATTYPHGPVPEGLKDGKYVYSFDADVRATGEGWVTDRDLTRFTPSRGSYKEAAATGNKAAAEIGRERTAAWWDGAVGAIIQALKQTGAYENTIIVYQSDHGGPRHGKTTLYETGVRVPSLMQWPAKAVKGVVYSHVTSSVDITPTILDCAGVQVPQAMHMDGVSLKPVLMGSSKPVQEALFLQLGYACGVKTDTMKYIAVRYPKEIEEKISLRETFKGLLKETLKQPYLTMHAQLCSWAAGSNPHYFERDQLYDLVNDPEEKVNLFTQKPEEAKKMQALLAEKIKKHIPHRPFGEFNP